MLRTVPRSIRHSAVCLSDADAVHSSPNKLRFDLFPSTARSAEYLGSVKGWSCHVDFLNARLSKKINEAISNILTFDALAHTYICIRVLSRMVMYSCLLNFSKKHISVPASSRVIKMFMYPFVLFI